jgi:hypothetical protein
MAKTPSTNAYARYNRQSRLSPASAMKRVTPAWAPTKNSTTVGEYRKKKRIHAAAFLQHIQNFLRTLRPMRSGY